MRRFLPALLLSLAIHAALLVLLPENGLEQAPRAIIRVRLTALPGGNGDAELPPSPYSEPPSGPPALEARPQPPPPEPQKRPPEPMAERTPAQPRESAPPEEPRNILRQNETARESASSPGAINAAPPSAEPVGEGGREVARAPEETGIVDASRLRVTRRVPAEYPAISRRRRDQGTVVLLLRLSSGRVTSVEVERSSGHSALDESAKRAASAWEFDTAGFGESLTVRIPFVFSLTGL